MSSKKRSEFRPNLDTFGVPRLDPGWLYIAKDATRFKVGKTTNPKRRLLEARTWLPNVELVGVKPFWNISALERQLHSGLAQFWVAGEWHEFPDDTYDFLFEDFREFYDEDRDMNSVDFIYWIGSSGMGELLMEHSSRKISLRKWQREAGPG
jgi:hypothetical protein